MPRRAFGLLLRLDALPCALDMARRDHAILVGEHMRMPPDHLPRDGFDDIAEGKRALFLGHAGMKYDLQQQIAEFIAEIGEVAARDRVGDFVGFLDGVGRNARKRLFEVPRAAATGRSQLRHDVEQAFDIAGRGHDTPVRKVRPVCRKMPAVPAKRA